LKRPAQGHKASRRDETENHRRLSESLFGGGVKPMACRDKMRSSPHHRTVNASLCFSLAVEKFSEASFFCLEEPRRTL
jgi:hypothetical protein